MYKSQIKKNNSIFNELQKSEKMSNTLAQIFMMKDLNGDKIGRNFFK